MNSGKSPIALVTGAAGGIGGALAAGFAGAGYEVIRLDRAPGEGIVALDVRDGAAVAEFGATLDRLDVLVNAAGINRQRAEYEMDIFEEVLDINLTAAMRLSNACRAALAKDGGAIINIASMLSFFGGGHAPAYSASKGGVSQLTKSLAIGWAKEGIRVNALAPGWIVTPMTVPARSDAARNQAILDRTPMGRWGHPEDLVGPALFLASGAARFVTGVVLPVDGGYAAM